MRLSFALAAQITAHVAVCAPEEACGLVGGAGGEARIVLPVENALHSPVRFFMQPAQQLHALLQLEAAGLALSAIFHSHPQGPAEPSPSDVAEFFYPDSLVLIVSPVKELETWQIRAFSLANSQVFEVKLELYPDAYPI